MSDESLTDATPKPEADVALTETTPEAVDPEPIKPADFDLMAWLSGIGPEVARYPLAGGGFIPLRARTMDWRLEWAKSTEDADPVERARIFLAAHIADDRITPEALEVLAEHRPKDFDEVCALALLIDDKPSNQIAPRFLPAASD